MNDRDPLLDQLRILDPVDPATIEQETRHAESTKRQILATPVDELTTRRRRRRRTAAAVAAAAVAAALLVPLALLWPLSDEPPTPPISPATSPSDPPSSGAITVTQPAPGTRVTSPVAVAGDADVFEATVSIRILDATNNVIADTFTTATCGSGCRGTFASEVEFSVGTEQRGVIQVFEVSAEDGSKLNVVRIPVMLVPGPDDTIAAEPGGA